MGHADPKVMLTFRIGGENGGPYTSHQRILKSSLSQKYDIQPFYIENPRIMRHPSVFFKTVKHIKREKPALVHLAGLSSEGFLVMLACRMANVKTLVAIHGSSSEAIGYGKIAKAIFRFIETYTVKHATAVYGVSDYVSSWEVCKKANNYFGTVYNIPSFGEPTSCSQDIRRELCIAPNDILVFSSGRIIKDKGYDTLWKVIQEFKEASNIKFVVAGEGAYKDEWMAQVKEYGFEDKVFLLGYRNDIDAILSKTDIFIICTKHETLCISLLEAASHSLPLVASNVGGIPEIIKHGENGFLVNFDDVGGFKDAVMKLVDDKNLRMRMGYNARLRVDTVFSEESIVHKLDDVYTDIIKMGTAK